MLNGTIEFEVHVRYLEQGQMRRYEATLYAHNFMSATLAAEKLLYSNHPTASILSVKVMDVERNKKTAPRLVFANPNDPPKTRA